MSQPLTIECLRNGDHFASLYFHWGAYTSCVYYIGKMVIDGLKKRECTDDMTNDDVCKLLLDILEKDFVTEDYTFKEVDGTERKVKGHHGGMDCAKDSYGHLIDLPYWKAIGVEPELDGVSRSDGLIGVSDENKRNMANLSCAVEVLDFDSKTFSNHNFSRWNPADMIDEYDFTEEDLKNFPEIDTEPLEDFGWDEIDKVMQEFKELEVINGFIGREPISGEFIGIDE